MHVPSLSLSIYIYIYIYISTVYVYVYTSIVALFEISYLVNKNDEEDNWN